MLIEVFHGDDQVAIVITPDDNVESALDYAFRWTQNLEGSWSRPENPDHNDRVTVVAPLPVRNGKTYGLRSSMVGDLFITAAGERYRCASFGWDKL